jgi:hypothetical protein
MTQESPARPPLPRTQNPAWGFYGTMADAGCVDPEVAWFEVIGFLTDPDGIFRIARPEIARALLDSPWGRHLADELIGAEEPLRAIEELAQDRRWMRSTQKVLQALALAEADGGRDA